MFFSQKHVTPWNDRRRVPGLDHHMHVCFVARRCAWRARGREVYLKTPHLRHGVRTRMRKSTSTWHKTNMCTTNVYGRRNRIACPHRVLDVAYRIRLLSGSSLCTAPSAAPKRATTVAKPFGNARGQALYIPNDYENRKSKQTPRSRFTWTARLHRPSDC